MGEPGLEPLYLICGSDRGKVLRAVGRLRARVTGDGGAEELFDAAEADGRTVAGACDQLGLLASTRLVLVQGVEAWRAEDVQALATYAAAPAPGTVLAFVAGPGLRKDHKLRTLVPAAQTLAFDLPEERALPEHLRKEARRLGADIEPAALRRLVELRGTNAVALESELDKLATYAAGEAIDVATVDLLAVRGDDVSPFALTDAVSARDREAVYRALDRAFAAGEKPHALLPQIARHLDLVRRARRASDRGLDHRAFAREAGIHEFRGRKLFDAVSRWSERDAAAAVTRLAVADHAMKGGERIDPELALERALAEGLGAAGP
jgi:DNA polymerase III delta subunit